MEMAEQCEGRASVNDKDTKRRHWHSSDVFIVNFKQISHIVVFPLLTLNK